MSNRIPTSGRGVTVTQRSFTSNGAVDATSVAKGKRPHANGGSGSAWYDPVKVDLRDWGTVDLTGVVSARTALLAAIAEAQSKANLGSFYGGTNGGVVELPTGRLRFDGKIPVPEAIRIGGQGQLNTTVVMTSPFPDNCLFEPAKIDNTQELFGLSGMSIYGQTSGSTPTNNQANAGTPTTVATQVTTPYYAFDLVAVGSIANYAASGTLTVGTKRIIYQSLDIPNKTFKNCFTISNDIAVTISAADTITPVTTDNVSAIHMLAVAFPSHVHDLWIEYFTGYGGISGFTNAGKLSRVNPGVTNRDNWLHLHTRQQFTFEDCTTGYSGYADSGTAYGGLHVLGGKAAGGYRGGLEVSNLYVEQSTQNQIGLWLQNAGSVKADTVTLGGGANSGTQVGVQIDSDRTAPTTQDGMHSGNISLRNLLTTKVGRVPLKDNVPRAGGLTYVHPTNTTDAGVGITRYDTEDSSPGAVLPFAASTMYWGGQVIVQGTVFFQRVATGISGASFTADAANWARIGSLQDRERIQRLGTLASLRESYDQRYSSSNTLTLTSGTQLGAVVAGLLGESYGTVTFATSATAATWGSNNDGHWYVAVYDSAGNLVTQTADQGHTGLAAFAIVAVALQATITPAADTLYSVVLMVYPGTGGSPVVPTVKCALPITSSNLIFGLPKLGISANTGQTTGTAPGTLGSVTAATELPYIALST